MRLSLVAIAVVAVMAVAVALSFRMALWRAPSGVSVRGKVASQEPRAPMGQEVGSASSAIPSKATVPPAMPASPRAPSDSVTQSVAPAAVLYVPRGPTEVAAIAGIKTYFNDPSVASAYVQALDETCALEQRHELEAAGLRSQMYEAIASQQPPTVALDLRQATDDYVADLNAAVDKEMAFIPPDGPAREPFRGAAFRKLLAEECPSVFATP